MTKIHYTKNVKRDLYNQIMNEKDEVKRDAIMEQHFISVEELASWKNI